MGWRGPFTAPGTAVWRNSFTALLNQTPGRRLFVVAMIQQFNEKWNDLSEPRPIPASRITASPLKRSKNSPFFSRKGLPQEKLVFTQVLIHGQRCCYCSLLQQITLLFPILLYLARVFHTSTRSGGCFVLQTIVFAEGEERLEQAGGIFHARFSFPGGSHFFPLPTALCVQGERG